MKQNPNRVYLESLLTHWANIKINGEEVNNFFGRWNTDESRSNYFGSKTLYWGKINDDPILDIDRALSKFLTDPEINTCLAIYSPGMPVGKKSADLIGLPLGKYRYLRRKAVKALLHLWAWEVK